MAGHYINTVEDQRTGRPVNGATILVYQDGASISGDSVTSGTLATIYSDDGVTTINQSSSPVTTGTDGEFDFYTNETRVVIAVLLNGNGLAVWNDIDIIGGTVSSDVTALAARVDNHDTLLGYAANATDLGTFTGSTISDNTDLASALEEVDAALDLYLLKGQFTTTTNILQSSSTGQSGGRIRAAVSSASNPTFSFEDDTDTGMFRQGADALAFSTGGTERVRIDGSGNLTVAGTNVFVETVMVACSDENTVIDSAGTKLTFRLPFAMTLTSVRASLKSACSTGTFTVDINEGGATILSTKLTIDATEKTSVTAATAAVISDSALADDAEITIDVDDVGDGTATGLKVALIGVRA